MSASGRPNSWPLSPSHHHNLACSSFPCLFPASSHYLNRSKSLAMHMHIQAFSPHPLKLLLSRCTMLLSLPNWTFLCPVQLSGEEVLPYCINCVTFRGAHTQTHTHTAGLESQLASILMRYWLTKGITASVSG